IVSVQGFARGESNILLERLYIERSLSVNTAAAGGNASLMTIGDRNFLRLRALPLLQQRWPHFPAAVARSATLCAEQERLLDELL
ncbi:hypothetical protein ONJ45_27175, partial [Salmonella enterica subsp. enterica serovar Virginia]|nr:hypothetical protein [Salmonella enterica subsp. enterica serovar Virginia]